MASHKVLGDKVRVYRRANSSVWQCSTYLEGKEWRVSKAELPVAQEDHLDCLRPVLDAPEPSVEHGRDERHPYHEGEERMPTDMQREDVAPDDYLDWWRSDRRRRGVPEVVDA